MQRSCADEFRRSDRDCDLDPAGGAFMRSLNRFLLRRSAPRNAAQIHRFTLHLAGVDLLAAEHVDALFAAGCGDAVFGSCDGRWSGRFARRAESLDIAAAGARAAVEAAIPGARVIRVESGQWPRGTRPLMPTPSASATGVPAKARASRARFTAAMDEMQIACWRWNIGGLGPREHLTSLRREARRHLR
jgi:hypothetical protein